MSADLKTQLAAANALYREGNFVEAERAFLDMHARDPENANFLMRLGELALWRNQPADAERYLTNALAHASRLAKMWPLNVQLKSSLAMTYYRWDKFPQAARYFHEAAGPIVLPPFHDLKALGDHLALFGGVTPYRVEGPETTSIPFVITDPLPVVEASINGGEPALFLIDTGGAELILDSETARKIGAQFAGTMSGGSAGSKGRLGLGKIDTIRLGGITVHDVPIHSLDMQPIAAGFELPLKGIIGTRLLMRFLATIDYPNACLTLRPKTAQVQAPIAHAIPFYLIQTHYIVAQGAINNAKPALFLVDTGLGGQGFTAPEAVLRDLGMTVDWSQAQKGVVGFGDADLARVTAERVTLGGGPDAVTAHHLPGAVFKKPFDVLGYTLGFYVGGVVSHLFFREYALTLDFAGMRLLLQG